VKPPNEATGVVEAQAGPRTVSVKLVDADIHPAPRSFAELREFVPEPYRSQGWLDRTGNESWIAQGSPMPLVYMPEHGARGDAIPTRGGAPGSDPDFAASQLFQEHGIDFGILTPLVVSARANPTHEAALFAGCNAWLADVWLTAPAAEGRFRGSICVCPNEIEMAVREIEMWSSHPGFVQVLLHPEYGPPLGNRRYHPIYEAAERCGLPVAIHVHRTPGMGLLTPVGFVSYYAEFHSLYSLLYITHLTSFLLEGVFELFPNLKLVLVEGGVAWLAPTLWRLDSLWNDYRAEVPELRRAPSDYAHEHVKLTTQPIEEPPDRRRLAKHLEWMDAGNTLMFASDYPHWDFDDPHFTEARLPRDIRDQVLAQNAIELYGLPRERPTEPPRIDD
jgi:uncharacterized protein